MVNKNLHLIAGLRPELKAILTDRNDAGEGGGTTTTLSFTTEEMKCLEKISTTIHMDGGPLALIQSISSGYFFEFLKKDEPQWSPPEEPAVQTLTAAQKKKVQRLNRKAIADGTKEPKPQSQRTVRRHKQQADKAAAELAERVPEDRTSGNTAATSTGCNSCPGDAAHTHGATGTCGNATSDSGDNLQSNPLGQNETSNQGTKRGRPACETGTGSDRTQRRQRVALNLPKGLRRVLHPKPWNANSRAVRGTTKGALVDVRAVLMERAKYLTPRFSAGSCTTTHLLKLLLAPKGPKTRLVQNLKKAIPDWLVGDIQADGVKLFKATLRKPERVVETLSMAGISIQQYETFWKHMMPEEKGVKIGRQTIVNARQTISDVMNTINPILPTPGGGGHRLSLARTLEMILPEYFRRCALKMFADNDPDKDFKDIRIPKAEVFKPTYTNYSFDYLLFMVAFYYHCTYYNFCVYY
jgi:hypothetical protein